MDNQTLLHEIRQWSQGIRYLSPIPVIEAVRLLFEQLESVQRERDEESKLRESAEGARDYHIEQSYHLEETIESLQRDKAALIEVLEWYGNTENSKCDFKYWGTLSNLHTDKGERARTILTQMKG